MALIPITRQISETKTPYAILCSTHEQVFLTSQEYDRQMKRPNSLWTCPICNEVAPWDDDNYDAWLDEQEARA